MMNSSSPIAVDWPRWRDLLLFLILGAILASTSWPEINRINYELGDFAANSLLIQDAKSLSLIHGNYSRVGFNHPGPAILYVLAAGEFLFYDCLHLVKSAFSGQLLAVAYYNAAWIVLMFALARKIFRSLSMATFFVSVFVLVTALCDGGMFVGIWFPHLYIFPFAALLVSVSRLAYGETDSLPSLAICCGFLINGHVSFVAINGIILIGVLAFNYFLTGSDTGERILGKVFWQRHWRRVAAAGAIVLLFLLPLLIASVLDDPAPVTSYLQFSHQNKSNSWHQAANFVAVYWGPGSAPLMGLVLACLTLASLASTPALARAAKSLLSVALCATLALLYYARVGIDMLDQRYIGFFYYAVPALMIALAAVCCLQARASLRRPWIAIALSCVCLLPSYANIKPSAEFETFLYNEAQMADAYKALRVLHPSGRLVLDLDSASLNYTWGRVVGLQAFAKRRHDDLLCVHENWHILFTRAGACTPNDLLHGPRFLVNSGADRDGDNFKPSELNMLGLSFHPFVVPDISGGAITVAAQAKQFDENLLRSGWSRPETDMVWSIGAEADLSVHTGAGASKVGLDVMAFLPHADSRQQVAVYVNDQLSATYDFNSSDNRKVLTVPIPPASRASPALAIRLLIAAPISPKQAGLSDDTRPLGLALFGISP